MRSTVHVALLQILKRLTDFHETWNEPNTTGSLPNFLFLTVFIKCNRETVYCSQYGRQATWETAEEVWYDGRQVQEIFLSFRTCIRLLGSPSFSTSLKHQGKFIISHSWAIRFHCKLKYALQTRRNDKFKISNTGL